MEQAYSELSKRSWCRARQASVTSNLEDILVCILIISSRIVAKSRHDIFNTNRQSAVLHVEATDDSLEIYSMYLQWTKNFGFDDETVSI